MDKQNKHKLIRLAIVCGVLLQFGISSAQEGENNHVEPRAKMVEFTIDRALPVYTFRQELGKDLWGFTAAYYWELKKSRPYDFLGFHLNYTHIGSITNNYLFYTGLANVEVQDRTGSSFWGAHLAYRYYPDFFFWRIEPFGELSFGSSLFFTSTTREFFDGESSTDFDINEFDMSVSYGFGAGFTMQIYQQVFFIFKASLYGGNAVTYLVDGNGSDPVPLNNFEKRTSQTNYFRMNFGIAVNFL